MKRLSLVIPTFVAILAGGAGYLAGAKISILRLPVLPAVIAIKANAEPAAPEPVIYFRDPNGRPAYSAAPKTNAEGRAYLPVHASEDVGSIAPSKVTTRLVTDGASNKIVFYRNPMGLPDTSPVPKKDSMGMDYIPVYAGDQEEGNTVKISPSKIQRSGVRTQTVSLRVIAHPIRVPGTVQLDERRIVVVATRSDAFVEKVWNVTTGDRVRKNQPLVQLYSPEINAAAGQFMANPGFEGARRRMQNLNVPTEAIAEIERTHNVPATITWSSPRDGLVLERGAIEGMKAAAGQTLFRIADVALVWVLADVDEYNFGSVKVGQTATVRVRSLPGRTFTGRIGLIYPQVNKETRTTRVRIELVNADGALLPDMYADVDIATGALKPVVAVPNDAVIDSGEKRIVLLDKGEGRFEPREVKLGTHGDGYVEVQQGIVAGDKVVTSANFLIDAESNLKAALQGLAANGSKP